MLWVKIEQKIVASDRLITANISGLDNRTFRHTAEKTEWNIWKYDGKSVIEKMD